MANNKNIRRNVKFHFKFTIVTYIIFLLSYKYELILFDSNALRDIAIGGFTYLLVSNVLYKELLESYKFYILIALAVINAIVLHLLNVQGIISSMIFITIIMEKYT